MTHCNVFGSGGVGLITHNPPDHPLCGFEHFCSICGDRCKGKHFGVHCCLACNSFFRRTIGRDLSFTCENKNCMIDLDQRNKCQYCRYQRCLAMGMKREAVKNERQRLKESYQNELQLRQLKEIFQNKLERRQLKERDQNELERRQLKERDQNELERRQMQERYQNELERRQMQERYQNELERRKMQERYQNELERQQMQERYQNELERQQMKDRTQNELESISSFHSGMPIEMILEAERRIDIRVERIENYENANTLFEEIQKQLVHLIEWAQQIPHFTSLPIEDQLLLLRKGWNELLLAGFSHRSVRYREEIVLRSGVTINRNTAEHVGFDTIIFDRVVTEVVPKMREIKIDKAALGCLRAIILYNPGVGELKSAGEVEALRDKVYLSLEKYTCSTYPEDPLRFAKLLLRLPTLRAIGLKCHRPLFFYTVLHDVHMDTFLLEMLKSTEDFIAETYRILNQ